MGGGGLQGGREENKGGDEMNMVSTDVKTHMTEANTWRCHYREVGTELQHMNRYMRGSVSTTALYLCGDALAGAVLQKEPNNLQVVLLGCHVQRSEAILHTTRTKTETVSNTTHSYLQMSCCWFLDNQMINLFSLFFVIFYISSTSRTALANSEPEA